MVAGARDELDARMTDVGETARVGSAEDGEARTNQSSPNSTSSIASCWLCLPRHVGFLKALTRPRRTACGTTNACDLRSFGKSKSFRDAWEPIVHRSWLILDLAFKASAFALARERQAVVCSRDVAMGLAGQSVSSECTGNDLLGIVNDYDQKN